MALKTKTFKQYVQVQCPLCHKGGRIKLTNDQMSGAIDGGTRLLVFEDTGICPHRLITYIDPNFQIRGYLRSDCTYADPPQFMQNFSTMMKDNIIRNHVGNSQFFINHTDEFLRLMANYHYFNPIVILYNKKDDIGQLASLLILMQELNPEYYEFVLLLSPQNYSEYVKMYKHTEQMAIYSFTEKKFLSSPLIDSEYQLFKEINLTMNIENYIEYLKEFFNLSTTMTKNVQRIKTKTYMKKHKSNAWLSTNLYDYMLTRNEMIARNSNEIWGNKTESFFSKDFQSYIVKQLDFDKKIQNKITKLSLFS